MNLGAVETFMVVVATKSISKAADKLFVTQSTVSQQIKSLENELGVNLLDLLHIKVVGGIDNGISSKRTVFGCSCWKRIGSSSGTDDTKRYLQV